MISCWRQIQRENFTCIQALADFLELDCDQRKTLLEKSPFSLNLPIRLANKIKKKTLEDPLLKQFVPLKAEEKKSLPFLKDPVGDCQSARTTKLLQKYAGRALLLTTGGCAMHCRYCFRQNYLYAPLSAGFLDELSLIQQDTSLHEVILSGGDPLSLANQTLKDLMEELSAIPHIKRLRFHSRFPLGIPERIDAELLAIFSACSKQIWFVIHCNHPKELDNEVLFSLKSIQKLGIPVLNQMVLLKDVNDSLEILESLCETLINHGIFPYYLHQLDRVEGASHFEVNRETGKALIEGLNKKLSGYGIPKYVEEIAKEPSKTLIF
jgi:EF-P beta-lysylation protein EpmB